ncbi:hypothetical protein BJ742DRAFT_812032 [Cladochytrium replicatum]|nr:hypothetical protein BJ742DRAFT_812032 [Cladochytrium replicatum]
MDVASASPCYTKADCQDGAYCVPNGAFPETSEISTSSSHKIQITTSARRQKRRSEGQRRGYNTPLTPAYSESYATPVHNAPHVPYTGICRAQKAVGRTCRFNDECVQDNPCIEGVCRYPYSSATPPYSGAKKTSVPTIGAVIGAECTPTAVMPCSTGICIEVDKSRKYICSDLSTNPGGSQNVDRSAASTSIAEHLQESLAITISASIAVTMVLIVATIILGVAIRRRRRERNDREEGNNSTKPHQRHLEPVLQVQIPETNMLRDPDLRSMMIAEVELQRESPEPKETVRSQQNSQSQRSRSQDRRYQPEPYPHSLAEDIAALHREKTYTNAIMNRRIEREQRRRQPALIDPIVLKSRPTIHSTALSIHSTDSSTSTSSIIWMDPRVSDVSISNIEMEIVDVYANRIFSSESSYSGMQHLRKSSDSEVWVDAVSTADPETDYMSGR